MYAIIQTGGKQYRVSEGDSVRIEKIAGEPGEKVHFEEVLFVGDADAPAGSPTVAGAQVTATVVEHGRGDKILVSKFKKRKMYRRKNGHRQSYTEVRIDEVQLGGTAKKRTAEKAAKPSRKTASAKAETKAEAKADVVETAEETPKAVEE